VLGLLAALLGAVRPAEEGGKQGAESKPPWQRYLQGDDARKAAEQEKQLVEWLQAGNLAEAMKVAEGLAELRRKVQGADHWQAVNSRWLVAALRCIARQGEQTRKEYARVAAFASQVVILQHQGRFREVQSLEEKLLALRRKVLGENHPHTAQSYNNLAFNLNAQGKYAEAEEVFNKALAIRRKVLGEEHPDTATSYANLAALLDSRGKHGEAEGRHRKALAIRRKVLGEEHAHTAQIYNNLATNLQAQGRYAEAREGLDRARAICRRLLGEGHHDTAQSYANLATLLEAQGEYAEAERHHRKALAIFRKALGEEHPRTVTSYNNLALTLHLQGKYTEAEEGHRKVLAICRKVFGEDHPKTAGSYNNLAGILDAQGKCTEAEEGFRKALAICRKVLGEEHPHAAQAYNNLAVNQSDQRKYAEAEDGHRKALAIRRKALGEEHPDTAQSYNNLGLNRNAQGKYAEAEKNLRKALAIRRKVLGEGHPQAGQSYNNLAANLNAQGKYDEAKENLGKALTICRRLLGEEHPETARTQHNLAALLNAQGKYAEAEEGHRKALAISREVLGVGHPHTALTFAGLAYNQHCQGKYAEAEQLWRRAAEIFARGRLRLAGSGLERATLTSERSPLPWLAAVLARNGKSEEAWQRFEESLARGTWDDLTARRRPADVRNRQAQLGARIDQLSKLIDQTTSAGQAAPAQCKRRDELLTQLRHALDDLADFTRRLETTYGPVAGQVFGRDQIQAALPPDAALVGWLDTPSQSHARDPGGEHWAVLLLSCGDPLWVRLAGSGDKEAWTDADTRLPAELRSALQSAHGPWQQLAGRLGRQRLQPLAKHLKGVRHLVVLPSTALAGVPVEVIAEGYTVSYAQSGTMYAHLRRQPAAAGKGFFALADPVFDPPGREEKSPPLPPAGVLLTGVLPDSNAARAGLRPNDVLLRYGDRGLVESRDLEQPTKASSSDRPVPVVVWRDGKPLSRPLFVQPGELGVVLAREPAPQAVAEQLRLDRRLTWRGSEEGKWDRLPGTRVEATSLQRLFGSERTRVLLDSEAGEQQLDELAQSGELGKYRYLHLATHGEVDNTSPLRSALILSRDRLPNDSQRAELLLAGRPIPDGRLTAEEVLRRWSLSCDLVTLSACQSALGKYEQGEGFVGFAQALVLCGSRSVCLSLWKVDDTATALLMERFYQNLLGKREGLSAALPRAEALAEARAWLRNMPREEATKYAARLSRGVARGKGPALPPLEGAPAEAADAATRDHPFAHPYYWAAFVLVGQAN
jgi:tetratricopeptide (TPR) repeat protein